MTANATAFWRPNQVLFGRVLNASPPGKFRGVCYVFGLPGTTCWKLPVPRKPVPSVFGLILEKYPLAGWVTAYTIYKITSACSLACKVFPVTGGLLGHMDAFNPNVELVTFKNSWTITLSWMHDSCSWERGVQYLWSHCSICINWVEFFELALHGQFNSGSTQSLAGSFLKGWVKFTSQFLFSAMHASSIFPSSTPVPPAVTPPNNSFAASYISSSSPSLNHASKL